MKRLALALFDQTVEVHCPDSVASDVEVLFRDSLTELVPSSPCITVGESHDGLFSIQVGSNRVQTDLTRGDLPTFLMEEVIRALIVDLQSAVAMHAGAVSWTDRAILIAGPTGSGKSSLVAWLVENGFEYLSDELTLLPRESSKILGFPRSLVIKPGAAETIVGFHAFKDSRRISGGTHLMLRPQKPPTTAAAKQCGLIIFPRFVERSEVQIHGLSAAEAALRLVGCNLNARNLQDGGFAPITRLSRGATALTLEYGDFDQLPGTIDVLAKLLLDEDCDATSGRRFLSAFSSISVASKGLPSPIRSFPAPTPRRGPSKLTIGMATYDDFDGVYFSLQALRVYHSEIMNDTELLVVDNHPSGACAQALKSLETSIANYRYVPMNARCGTATAKDSVFQEASGEFVLCMDSHVFIVPGALRKLLDYFDANRSSRDLLQGPMLYDDLSKLATHFDPKWRGGMYGTWEMDERGAEPKGPPFEIPMQGLGLFGCRKDAWPGFNPQFRGFGGEEGYIHEKFRRAGGRTLCLPFLRWLHRFIRPSGVPYSNTWEDRIRNYTIGFRELGLPMAELQQHFREYLGSDAAERIFWQIQRELDGARSLKTAAQ